MLIHDSSGIGISKENPLSVNGSARKATVVTPNNTTVIPATNGLYIGGTGDIAVTMSDGADVIFTAILGGVIHPLSVTKVKATGTTATNIVVVY